MSHQSEKPISPKMAVEGENSKIEAAASKQPPPAFFYSNGNSRLSPTENGQSSLELSSLGSNSPDQFEDKLRKCSAEIQKLREEMTNLKGNNRMMNLKLEKAEICQKAQLRAAKAEAEVNAIGRELGERMEEKDQKVGAKLVEMEKQMENMKKEMDILKQNGAGSSGGAAAGGNGNGNGRQQYVSLAMSGDFDEGEGDQRPLLVNNSAANAPNGAMEKMKGQICCLKSSNLVLFILAISMGALLGWFTLKCPLMHFC